MRDEVELVKSSVLPFPPVLCVTGPVPLGSSPVCHRCLVGYRKDEAQSENCSGKETKPSATGARQKQR